MAHDLSAVDARMTGTPWHLEAFCYDMDYFAEFYLMVEGDQGYYGILEAYSRYCYRVETRTRRRTW